MAGTAKHGAVAAGHICLDITPQWPQGESIQGGLLPGRLYEMTGVNIHTGGAVANTGLAMKILGADVRLAGKVGTDYLGEIVLEQLGKYGAEKDMIVADGEQTSYSAVIAPPGIDRIFLHQPGANDTFSLSDLKDELLEDSVLFHFGYPPLMRNMYVDGGRELEALFSHVRGRGLATSLDLASVNENTGAGRADWQGILRRVLPYVDFFVPSAEELAYMLDRDRYERWIERASGKDITSVLNIERDVIPLAETALSMGAGVVLIKCGLAGLCCCSAGAKRLADISIRMNSDLSDWSDRKHQEKCYRPGRVLSGTGAGDTSIAAFLCAALRGFPFDKTLRLTSGTGASCVESYDALSGLRSFKELEQKIAGGWEKI